MTAPQPIVRTHGTITHTYRFEPSDDRTIRDYGEEIAVVCLNILRRDSGNLSVEWVGVPRLASGKWGRARRTGAVWWREPAPAWMQPLIDAVPEPVVTWEGQDR